MPFSSKYHVNTLLFCMAHYHDVRECGCIAPMPTSKAGFELPHATSVKTTALETRALALVNPKSGIANDYLNIFNEIIMLVENFPCMPELGVDIINWQPKSYRQYFANSSLPGRKIAMDAYERLDAPVRDAFEQIAEEIAALAGEAAVDIRLHGQNTMMQAYLSQLCAQTSAKMLSCLRRATHVVNFGKLQNSDDPQARIDRLISRSGQPGRRKSDARSA